mgnify:FL=1
MHLRDLSLKNRLLMTNALMVIIPVCVLLMIGAVLLGGLKHAGALQQQTLALLWPERSTALSVQFSLSSLRTASEKKRFKLRHIESDIHILEGYGVELLVVQQKKQLYLTHAANAADMYQRVNAKCGNTGSALRWDSEGIFFRYEGIHNGTVILGAGAVPMRENAEESLLSGDMRAFALNTALIILILCASLGILLLGRSFARILSAQILTPLSQMRDAAAAIQRGDLDHALLTMNNDEIGMTCRAFDAMRADLKRARAREHHEDERRRELLIGILHDLATPLTAIKGYASGLLDGIAATPEKQQQYAEHISRAALAMEQLTTRLRHFLRLGAVQLPLQWETVCVQDILMQMAAEYAPYFHEKALSFTFKTSAYRTFIRVDRAEFSRVIENLLENSSKYRRSDTASVQISCAEEGTFLSIFIDDDGMGASPEDLPKLFDSFYRTDPARTNVAGGSGLGLAIVRQIMTAFGGSARAEASPLGGLRIILQLPIIAVDQEDRHEEDSAHRG